MRENEYIKTQKEKILDFAREVYLLWEITEKQLEEVYFNHFVKK